MKAYGIFILEMSLILSTLYKCVDGEFPYCLSLKISCFLCLVFLLRKFNIIMLSIWVMVMTNYI